MVDSGSIGVWLTESTFCDSANTMNIKEKEFFSQNLKAPEMNDTIDKDALLTPSSKLPLGRRGSPR